MRLSTSPLCQNRFPYQSIRWVLDNWHEAGPRFVKLLEDCADGVDRRETTTRALFFVAHLLAEKRETRAFPALGRLAGNRDLCEVVLGAAMQNCAKGLLAWWNGASSSRWT